MMVKLMITFELSLKNLLALESLKQFLKMVDNNIMENMMHMALLKELQSTLKLDLRYKLMEYC